MVVGGGRGGEVGGRGMKTFGGEEDWMERRRSLISRDIQDAGVH